MDLLSAKPANGLGGNHICRPVAGDHFASLNAPVVSVNSNKSPLHSISPVNLDQNSIAPPTLRRSLLESSDEVTSAAFALNILKQSNLRGRLGAITAAEMEKILEKVG